MQEKVLMISMKSNLHDLAVLVGGPPADPIAKIMSELAVQKNYAFERKGNIPEVISLMDDAKTSGNQRSVIVLCGLTEVQILEGIQEIKRRKKCSRIIVCAMRIEENGRFPIRCIEEGACDYLVFNTYDPMILEQRIMLALLSQEPYVAYPPFNSLRGLRAFSVFVATPFAPAATDDYISAIKVALEHLEIPEQRADNERHFTSLLSGVTSQIENNSVVIGNITSYGSPANANVYLEIGYAMGVRKKVILLSKRTYSGAFDGLYAKDTRSLGWSAFSPNQFINESIPADIEAIERVQYFNCADLALQLYFGFRDLPAIAKRLNR